MSEVDSSERRRHDDHLLDEAAEWIGRLRSPDLNGADRQAFSRWLLRSPAHRAAFDTMADLWDGLGTLAEARDPLPTPAAASARRRVRRPLVMAASAMAAMLLVTLAFLFGLPGQVHETAPGEMRTVELEDGTRVTLNTDSRLRVRYGSRQRLVRLATGGEAFFEVVADPRRPFVVESAHGRARAVGTAYSVHAREHHSLVTVTEGRVAVTPALRPEKPSGPVEVTAGQELFVSAGAAPSTPEPLDPQRLSWREGRLVYDDVPLTAVIDDLNRYMPQRMTISDPELARTRISAVLSIREQEAMLQALSEALPLKWVRVSDQLVIIHPA